MLHWLGESTYLYMYVYMSLMLQLCMYYVPICRRLPQWLQYAAMACCFSSVLIASLHLMS